MRQIALAGLGIAALVFAPLASADATPQYVHITNGPRCEVSADQVDCQGGFTNAPRADGIPAMPGCLECDHNNQANVTSEGAFSWGYGNLGQDDQPGGPGFTVLVPGQTYDINGWTITAGGAVGPSGHAGAIFTNDASGRGLTISNDNTARAS
jgi:hypothetical protein